MRRLTAIVATAMLALGLSVSAVQQASTILLSSGETVTGELVDHGGVGFTVRVGGQDRVISQADVVSIDFGGGPLEHPAAARDLAAGNSLVVLRSGEAVAGQFYDVSGTTPLRIVVRTPSGERTFMSNDVRRIYMQRAPGAPATAADAPPAALTDPIATVAVSARTGWTDSGITVAQGERLRFAATGTIVFSPRGHRAPPAGSEDNLRDTNAPVRTALQGALIGRVGGTVRGRGAAAGTVFVIGSQTSVVMPAGGQLFLGINDSGLDDNSGQFSVQIGR